MPDRQPEMIMPVPDQGAALQFFVEAMKANTATLQQVGKTLQGVQSEQKETLRLINDTRERVIKLESGGHAETVNTLKGDIEKLEEEIRDLKSVRDRHTGAVEGLNAILKYGPIMIVIVGAVVLFLRARGEL